MVEAAFPGYIIDSTTGNGTQKQTRKRKMRNELVSSSSICMRNGRVLNGPWYLSQEGTFNRNISQSTDSPSQISVQVEHASTVKGFLRSFIAFSEVCSRCSMKRHLQKCNSFSSETRWCGRVISNEGVSFAPRHIDGIQDVDTLVTCFKLQQFLFPMRWMSNTASRFFNLIQALSFSLEQVYKITGRRTKCTVSNVQVSRLECRPDEESAFLSSKRLLKIHITCAHQDSFFRFCVYSDAFDAIWCGLLTQVSYRRLFKAP